MKDTPLINTLGRRLSCLFHKVVTVQNGCCASKASCRHGICTLQRQHRWSSDCPRIMTIGVGGCISSLSKTFFLSVMQDVSLKYTASDGRITSGHLLLLCATFLGYVLQIPLNHSCL